MERNRAELTDSIIEQIIVSTSFVASDWKIPKTDQIKDEPGVEHRFLRGVKKALKTPPKPFTKPTKDKDAKR